jgi:hypothetical protein
MPDGFSRHELEKPLSPAKLTEMDRERQALDAWWRTGDYEAVMTLFDLTKPQARILINRAIERWTDEGRETIGRRIKFRQTEMLEELVTKQYDAISQGDLKLARDLLATFERLSKLWGIDTARDEDQVMPNIQVIVGLPDERGDVVDGTFEVQDVAPNELEAPGESESL